MDEQDGFWALDLDVVHLNHGSFGATPAPVLAAQLWWRQQMEANPTRFLTETFFAAIE